MKIHNGVAVGSFELTSAPVEPNHAVRKQDLDAAVSGGAAPIFIIDVTPQSGGDNVGLKSYAATVPANAVIEECTADTASVRIHFIAEGPQPMYNPTVTYEGVEAQSMSEHPTDVRLFQGYCDVTLAESGDVTLVSSTGATATVSVNLAIGGPSISSITIGSYPGTQTAIKSGDTVSVAGVVDNSAVSATVQDAGAASGGSLAIGAEDSAGAGLRTISGTFTASNRTGTLPITVVATNILNTAGDPAQSGNNAVMDQTYPSIATVTFTYPAGQQAGKNGQTITATAAVSDGDVIAYSFEQGTVDADTTAETNKTLNVVGSVYDPSAAYSITYTRTANNATTVRNADAVVAGVAATVGISISGNPARLRSAAGGNDYLVIVSSNQSVHTTEAPTLTASAGTWQGSWTRSGNTWRRNLRIEDATARGAATFSGLSLMNRALIETTTINSGENYEVGGFEQRTITFDAFSQTAAIGTVVGDATKIVARYAGTAGDLDFYTDLGNHAEGFSVTDSGASGYIASGGTHLFLNDVSFASSNTSGTLQVEVEELA